MNSWGGKVAGNVGCALKNITLLLALAARCRLSKESEKLIPLNLPLVYVL